MKPAPKTIATIRPGGLLQGSPRPISCPTRTAAAELIPSGTINVSEAQLNAISCPDKAMGPSRAHIAVATVKAPISKRICVAAGMPSRNSSIILLKSRLDAPFQLSSFLLDSTHSNVITRTTPDRCGRLRWTSRADDAHRGQTEMAVDQGPVANDVDQVGRNQRERDGMHYVHRLQIAAQGKINDSGNDPQLRARRNGVMGPTRSRLIPKRRISGGQQRIISIRMAR